MVSTLTFLEESAVSKVDLNDDVVHRTENELNLIRVLVIRKEKGQFPLKARHEEKEGIRTVAQVK